MASWILSWICEEISAASMGLDGVLRVFLIFICLDGGFFTLLVPSSVNDPPAIDVTGVIW